MARIEMVSEVEHLAKLDARDAIIAAKDAEIARLREAIRTATKTIQVERGGQRWFEPEYSAAYMVDMLRAALAPTQAAATAEETDER